MDAKKRLFSDNDASTADIIMSKKETSTKENMQLTFKKWFKDSRSVVITHTYLLKKWVFEVDIAAPGHTCGRIFDKSVTSKGKVVSNMPANIEVIEIDNDDEEDEKMKDFSHSGNGEIDSPFIID